MSSFFIKESTTSWKVLLTPLVDRKEVGRRVVASCCTFVHFLSSFGQWWQVWRCRQSSSLLINPKPCGQGRKLCGSGFLFGALTTISFPWPVMMITFVAEFFKGQDLLLWPFGETHCSCHFCLFFVLPSLISLQLLLEVSTKYADVAFLLGDWYFPYRQSHLNKRTFI